MGLQNCPRGPALFWLPPRVSPSPFASNIALILCPTALPGVALAVPNDSPVPDSLGASQLSSSQSLSPHPKRRRIGTAAVSSSHDQASSISTDTPSNTVVTPSSQVAASPSTGPDALDAGSQSGSMDPTLRTRDRAILIDAVARASTAAASMPRTMDSLRRAALHDHNLYTPTYARSVVDLESAQAICINQYILSGSHGGQLLAAFNTGMMLNRLKDLVPSVANNRDLSKLLNTRGLGERQVWAHRKFANEIVKNRCYKALVAIHDLPWSVVGRQPAVFVELLVSNGLQAFVVDE